MESDAPVDPIEALASASTFEDVEAALGGANRALHLRHDTAEMHYFVLRGELARGADARHAAEHLAGLLSFGPDNDSWLSLVDDAEEKFGDLIPLLEPVDPQRRHFATEALRAYVSLGRGAIGESARTLAAVAKARPDVRYLDAWLLPILETEGLDGLDDELGARVLGALVDGCPEHASLSSRRLEAMEGWADVAISLVARSGAPSPLLLMMAAGVCRRAGRGEEGLGLLDRAPRSWATLTARALILRHAGRLDEAVTTFEEAGRLEPKDRSWMLEAGDALFDAERWSEARSFYGRVLAEQPRHEWAEPSARSCDARSRGERQEPPEVVALARAGNRRARILLADRGPWVGFVPRPTDALASGLLQAHRQGSSGAIRSAVTHWESPSNRSLHHLLFGATAGFDVSFGEIGQPDPREPVGAVEVQLWKRVGESLFPALAAPSSTVVDPVTSLASSRFRRPQWWAAAGRIATAYRASDLTELLACVVRPPPPKGGVPAEEWIPRVQLVAAFVIAQVAPDEPWRDSARRRGLLSILHGPMDWSTNAAIVALVCATEDEPAIATDVHRAFARLLLAEPDRGAVPWFTTLLSQWSWVRGLFPREREALQARLSDRVRLTNRPAS